MTLFSATPTQNTPTTMTTARLVTISLEKQKMIGVRVEIVEKGAGTHTIRTTGKVETEENRLFRLSAAWRERSLSRELWSDRSLIDEHFERNPVLEATPSLEAH